MKDDKDKIASIIIAIFSTIVGVAVLCLIIAGSIKGIELKMDSDKIVLSGGMFYSTEISFEDIEKLEERDSIVIGKKDNGADIGNLRAGHFKNDEFGKYSLYIDKGIKKNIVVTMKDGSKVVFNYKSEEETEDIYKELLGKAGIEQSSM